MLPAQQDLTPWQLEVQQRARLGAIAASQACAGRHWQTIHRLAVLACTAGMQPGCSSHMPWGLQPGCIVLKITSPVGEEARGLLAKQDVPGFADNFLDYFQKESWVQ